MSKTVISKWNSMSSLKVCSSEFESGWGSWCMGPDEVQIVAMDMTQQQKQMAFNSLENIIKYILISKENYKRINLKAFLITSTPRLSQVPLL